KKLNLKEWERAEPKAAAKVKRRNASLRNKKIKTGNIKVPDSAFKDENITAHISIKLPLTLFKELRRLSLNEKYDGKYKVLIINVLTKYIKKASKRK
ncbi:MAG TPA: hypothetical protein VIG33_08165, partial [Pseudobdellovibrionaceae bacterium]